MSLTLRQVCGFLNAPNKIVRQLAETAVMAMESLDEARRECRELQERIAAEQLDKDDRLLIVFHPDGLTELWSNTKRLVRFAHTPDLPGRPEEAEAWMLSRLPLTYRTLYENGQVIARDNSKCLTRAEYELVQYKIMEVEAMKGMEQ